MNTAAGMVSGSCVMPEGSPEPDTHVNYAPTIEIVANSWHTFCTYGVGFLANCWLEN
jgi:hypothetical protein